MDDYDLRMQQYAHGQRDAATLWADWLQWARNHGSEDAEIHNLIQWLNAYANPEEVGAIIRQAATAHPLPAPTRDEGT